MFQWKRIELYGGAMSVELPTNIFNDVSNFREVPDHQEIYTHADSGTCVITELNARQAEVADDMIAQHFFVDQATSMQALEPKIEAVSQLQMQKDAPNFPPTLPKEVHESTPPIHISSVCGTMQVSKYTNERGKENDVYLILTVLRLPEPVCTDFVIVMTSPQAIHPQSSEAKVVKQTLPKEAAVEMMRRVVGTVTIHEWGLFVPGPD